MIDLTNQKFGYLTVIKPTNKRSRHGAVIWECKCDCGKLVYAISGNLRSGNTNSCGCYNKQRIKETQTKELKYDLSGEYGIGWTSKGQEFYFDLEDYDKIKNYCWCNSGENYLIAAERGNRTHFISFSRLVMDVLNKRCDVDHINHNTFDNRKSNLRIATRTQNNMNRSLQSNNTSGVTGVRFEERLNKWNATITVKREKINLGWYTDKEDAIKARKNAEVKYFGEYRYKLDKENYINEQR